MSQKNVTLFIFQIALSKINQFWWFLVCWILRKFDINSLYICPPLLYTVASLPWEIQKSHFQQYYLCILQIICVISEENKLLLPYPPHLKNVTALPCKMHNFFIFFIFYAYRVPIRHTDELRKRLVMTWAEFQQSVVHDTVDQWRKRQEACVCAEGGHFEHLL